MTRSKFDIEYNERIQQVDVGDGSSVWDEIQDELDFIETWDTISTKLEEIMPQKATVAPMRYLRVFAAIAAIVLIMFLPVRNVFDQANQTIIISEISNEADQIVEISSFKSIPLTAAKEVKEEKEEGFEKLELAQRVVPELPQTKHLIQKPSGLSFNSELKSIVNNIDSASTTYFTEVLSLQKNQNFPFDVKKFLADKDTFSPYSIDEGLNYTQEPIKSAGISIRVVDIGLLYGYKNTWLLNHETRNGLNASKLGASLPTFRQDIGLTSSFEINNRHVFGLEFFWKSEAGQKYQQYINASYMERNIALEYLKLQSFYVWKYKRIPGEIIVGGYFSRLTMAHEIQDKTWFNVNDRYNDLDCGLLAGYQFNIAFKNGMTIKPSVRVSYNVVNIFKGDDITPSHFKRTNNLATSLNLSLSYRFLNKF